MYIYIYIIFICIYIYIYIVYIMRYFISFNMYVWAGWGGKPGV